MCLTGVSLVITISIVLKQLDENTRCGVPGLQWKSRLESPADPEHVAIRMAKVHLADIPRHIGGWKCDLQPGGHALLVQLVHVVHPDRHPDALIALFVSVLLKRGGVCAAAAASLRPLTKKNASFLA